MSKIRIGICGPPCSGKTTIAQLLKWKLREITNLTREVPREYARHYMEKYGPVNNIYQQLLIYDGQTKLEKQINQNYDITISDCPRMLSYIYAKHHFKYQDPQDHAVLTRLYELAIECIADYNIIFLLFPLEKFETDAIRCYNNKKPQEIYDDIKNFLLTHCKNITILLENKNEMEIVQDINNHLIETKII